MKNKKNAGIEWHNSADLFTQLQNSLKPAHLRHLESISELALMSTGFHNYDNALKKAMSAAGTADNWERYQSTITGLDKKLEQLINPPWLKELLKKNIYTYNPPEILAHNDQILKSLNMPEMAQLRAQSERILSLTNLYTLPKTFDSFLPASNFQNDEDRMRQMLSHSSLSQDQKDNLLKLVLPKPLDMGAQYGLTVGSGYPGFLTDVLGHKNLIGETGQALGLSIASRIEDSLASAYNSYHDILERSELASFLVKPKTAEEIIRDLGIINEGIEAYNSDENEDPEQGEIPDQKVVEALERGNAAQLSLSAINRIVELYLIIGFILDEIKKLQDRLDTLKQIAIFLLAVSNPSEINYTLNKIPNDQRELVQEYRIVNRPNVNLRTAPGTSSEIIATLRLTTMLEEIEDNYKGWIKVRTDYEGRVLEGWIRLDMTASLAPPKKR